MKKKRHFLLLILFVVGLGFSLSSFPSQTLADGAYMGDNATIENPNQEKVSQNQSKPHIVKKGGIELNIKRFPLSRYKANNEVDSGIKGIGVALSNMGFSFSQLVVLGVDTGLDLMQSLDPIQKFSTKFSQIGQHMFTVLKGHFAPLIWVWLIGYVAFVLFVRNNLRDATRRVLLFVVILLIGSWWSSNANSIVKSMNTVSSQSQGFLLGVTSEILQMDQDSKSAVFGKGKEIPKGKEAEGTATLLRNIYFDLALKKPYLITNYGTTDEKAINAKKGKDGKFSRIDTLLSYKLSESGENKRQDYIKNTEVKSYNNENMSSGNVWSQVGFSAIAPIASIILAVPFFGVELMNFLIQFAIVLLLLLMPWMFLIALVPQFAMTGFKGLGYLFGAFFLKIVMILLIAVVYAISYIVDVLVPPLSAGTYLVNFAILCIILLILILKRNQIVKFLTAGRVQTLDGNVGQTIKKEVLQPTQKGIQRGVQVGKGGARLTKAGAMAAGAGIGRIAKPMKEAIQRRSQKKAEQREAERNKDVIPMKDFKKKKEGQQGRTPQNPMTTSPNPSTGLPTPSTNQESTKKTGALSSLGRDREQEEVERKSQHTKMNQDAQKKKIERTPQVSPSGSTDSSLKTENPTVERQPSVPQSVKKKEKIERTPTTSKSHSSHPRKVQTLKNKEKDSPE